MKRILFALALVVSVSGCAVPASIGGRSTAHLTTPGIVALHTLEVVKVLDVLRDTAIDAEAAKIVSTEDARKIVTVHKAILMDAKEAPNGWKATALTSLYNLRGQLSSAALAIVGPYIDMALVLIKAVIS